MSLQISEDTLETDSLPFDIAYHMTRFPQLLPMRPMKNLVGSPDVGETPVPAYCSLAGRLNNYRQMCGGRLYQIRFD
jgi:hypothetical protein